LIPTIAVAAGAASSVHADRGHVFITGRSGSGHHITSAHDWQSFPKARLALGSVIQARGRITASLSIDLASTVGSFRVLDGRRVMAPGPVSFNGRGGHSFTFSSKGSKRLGCHEILIEWRAIGAEPAAVNGFDLATTATGSRSAQSACE